jgi:predicted MFS family arabinose efflux permease
VPAGLYLAATFSWHIPFLGIGMLGLLIIPGILLFIPKMTAHMSPGRKVKPLEVYKGVLSTRNQQMGLLMMFTLMLSHFATIPFIAGYMEKNVGFSKNEVALMYAIGGVCSFFASRLVGLLADRFGKHKVFAVSLLLSLVPVYLITHMPRTGFGPAMVVMGAFFIITSGRMVPAQALITAVVPARLRGGFMNLNSSLQQLAAGLISLITGMIVVKTPEPDVKYLHYETVGYISMAISLVCLVVLRFVNATGEGQKAPEAEAVQEG